jgi:hypothetical protein
MAEYDPLPPLLIQGVSKPQFFINLLIAFLFSESIVNK